MSLPVDAGVLYGIVVGLSVELERSSADVDLVAPTRH